MNIQMVQVPVPYFAALNILAAGVLWPLFLHLLDYLVHRSWPSVTTLAIASPAILLLALVAFILVRSL